MGSLAPQKEVDMKCFSLLLLSFFLCFSLSIDGKEIKKRKSKSDAEFAHTMAKINALHGDELRKDKILRGKQGQHGDCNVDIASPIGQTQINTDINVVANDIIIICDK